MFASLLHVLAAMTVALAPAAPALSAELSRCSRVPFPVARNPELAVLLGSATADTILAGPGDVEPSPGHWGRGRNRAIYGQVVEIERLAGSDSALLSGAFQTQGNRRVLIVPWDYDPSCRTAVWSRSAQWVPLGEPGTFAVRLRPPQEWAGGIPTFDAFAADLAPYPLGLFFQHGYRGTDALRTQPSLSAAEYFELYLALPEREASQQNPAAAAALMAKWENENPALAVKYPATEILRWVRWRAAQRP